MGQQLKKNSKLNSNLVGVEKSVFNRLKKLFFLDPKPSDLTMDRLKFFEKKMEGRTRTCGKRLR